MASKGPRWRIVRSCPYCRGLDVRRSHRKGLLEILFLSPFLIRPYRCNECDRRHYNFVFSRKVEIDGKTIQTVE